MIKKYIEIEIKIARENSSSLIYELHQICPLGIEIIDSKEYKKILGNLKNDEISDLEFEDSEDIYLKAYLDFDNSYLRKINEIDDLKKDFDFQMDINEVENDWSKEWMKYYSPIEVGKNILILPKWLDEESDRIKIYINPGMAFGTGYHETTRLVLSEIENFNLKDKLALDIGCGSGILSILLSKLGASSVDAVDIDEQALRATRENVSYNGISNVNIYKSNLFENVEVSFNLICANLLAGILVELMDDVDKYLLDDGILILSGIIEESEYKLIDKLKEKSYKIINRKQLNEWIMLTCKRYSDV